MTTEDVGDEVSPTRDSLGERIAARVATMSPAERRIAEYLRTHSSAAIFATAQQIAAATGTSDATVVRTARTLGYTGLQELRHSLGEEVVAATSPAVQLRERLTDPGSTSSVLVSQVFAEAAVRLEETARRLASANFDLAVDLVTGARTVFCAGIGPSELTARYLSLKLVRMGRAARFTGATGFRLADDLLDLAAADVVVLYWPGRLLGEMEVVLDRTETVGARTVLVSDSLGSVFAGRVDVVLPAAYSPGDVVGEGVTTQVLTDALLAAVRLRDEERATAAHETLTGLRSSLTQVNSPRRREDG